MDDNESERIKWMRSTAGALADDVADILKQEYKMHEDQWWLWMLDKPRRPLTDDEIERAQKCGLIPSATPTPWNKVGEALSELYETYSQIAPGLGEVLEAVEKLMKAYDDWLD